MDHGDTPGEASAHLNTQVLDQCIEIEHLLSGRDTVEDSFKPSPKGGRDMTDPFQSFSKNPAGRTGSMAGFKQLLSGLDTCNDPLNSYPKNPAGRRNSLPRDDDDAVYSTDLSDWSILGDFVMDRNFQVETQSQDLRMCTRLGSGSISKVFKTQVGNEQVAAKLLRVESVMSETPEEWPPFTSSLLSELRVLRKGLHHPNIVRFVGTGVSPYGGKLVPAILYEYMEGGCVESVMDTKSKELGKPWVPPRALSLSWSSQLLSALSFLHTLDPPIAHRDVKPANLLLSGDQTTLKLADFSLATEVHGASTEDVSTTPSVAGSFRFMAPEVFAQAGAFSLEKADLYSAAVTSWFMIFGERPYHFVADQWMLTTIVRQGIRPAVPFKEAKLSGILNGAWDANPKLRPTALQFLQMIQQLEQDLLQKKQSGVGGKIMRVLRKSSSFEHLTSHFKSQKSLSGASTPGSVNSLSDLDFMSSGGSPKPPQSPRE